METKELVASLSGTVVRLVLVIGVIFLVYKGATTCYDYGYRIFMEPAMTTEENAKIVEVTIGESVSAKDMGEGFEKVGLIRDGKLFILQYYLSEFRKDIKPGTYQLSTAMTVEEMMEAMTITQEEE
ncbi:MAG: hypothetical protein IJ335_09050 [Lachnospiraceae bacterium]|nr:hypothetical protein [Lachnospiraceae bacterium]